MIIIKKNYCELILLITFLLIICTYTIHLFNLTHGFLGEIKNAFGLTVGILFITMTLATFYYIHLHNLILLGEINEFSSEDLEWIKAKIDFAIPNKNEWVLLATCKQMYSILNENFAFYGIALKGRVPVPQII